jgi:L-malate glycosyltransferase
MNILHTVQFYLPSVGGAQEVVRQISEQLVRRGHTVTVATGFHPRRNEFELRGVHIEQFDISGNAVLGFHGEVERYREFLHQGQFDLMLNYAAQQWASDLVFPELDKLPFKKVFIPCGFSALYDPAYRAYYAEMPAVMRRYDHLIFHANHYRDVEFASENGLTHLSIIPNGASEEEFRQPAHGFRQLYSIPENVPLLLTIGTHTGTKGHRLILDAFRQLKTIPAVLVIIGNDLAYPGIWEGTLKPILRTCKRGDIRRFFQMLHQWQVGGRGGGCFPECLTLASDINHQLSPDKRVLLLDPSRAEAVSALHSADVFVFGSNIEYSPLVLFEAMASHTPFLTLACGNAEEIVDWSCGGGRIVPTIQKELGLVDGDPVVFARAIDEQLSDPAQIRQMARAGYSAWRDHFTWESIVLRYENLYLELLKSG